MSIEPQEIATRCERLGLKPSKLAALADLHPHTVARSFSGKRGSQYESVQAMNRALLDTELSLLRHLARLHPQQAIEQATVAMCPQPAVATKRAEAA